MQIELNKPFLKKGWVNRFQEFLTSYTFNYEDITHHFESKICTYTGSPYSLAVSNGTGAIFMILKTIMNNTDKNEIVTCNWGHPAIFRCCKMLGLKVVPVEMDPISLTFDLNDLSKSLTDKTLAVVQIQNNGILGDIRSILNLIRDDIFFIEDAAPSMLQSYDEKRAGTFGNIGFYSFSPTKPMICGEGAVIVTNSKDIYAELSKLRYNSDYLDLNLSFNFNLSPFLTAYLMEQFSSLHEVANARLRAHSLYKKYGLNIYEHQSVSNYYPYAMYKSSKAKTISDKLKKFDIGHRLKYYPVYDSSKPSSLLIQNQLIDLPCGHWLSEDEIKSICTLIKLVENDSI